MYFACIIHIQVDSNSLLAEVLTMQKTLKMQPPSYNAYTTPFMLFIAADQT